MKKIRTWQLCRTGTFGQDGARITEKDLREIVETFTPTRPITIGHDAAHGDNFPKFGDVLLIDGIYDDARQYLAHLIRTMEIFVRNQKSKEYFRITVTPNDSADGIESLAWASYSGDWYSFDIYYDKKLDEIQKRIAIAHELGHLFYDVISETSEQADRETLSTVFGIAAMLHKYQCKSDAPLYASEEELVSKFKLLQNRTEDILNVSGFKE